MNRQKQILFILTIILVLTVVWAYFSTPQQAEITASDNGQTATTRTARNDSVAKISVESQKVNLDLLSRDKRKYRGYKRDIFNFYQPPPPKPVVKAAPKPVVKPAPKPVVTPQVRQQLAKFTFLGFLVKENRRTVFLSRRDELFLVRSSEFFGDNDQFEVMAITEEKLTIRQRGANEQIEIILKEEEPLIPSFSPGELTERAPVLPVVNQSPPAAKRPQAPPQEQRKRWYKNNQPPADE